MIYQTFNMTILADRCCKRKRPSSERSLQGCRPFSATTFKRVSQREAIKKFCTGRSAQSLLRVIRRSQFTFLQQQQRRTVYTSNRVLYVKERRQEFLGHLATEVSSAHVKLRPNIKESVIEPFAHTHFYAQVAIRGPHIAHERYESTLCTEVAGQHAPHA
jgi:hypothetical protein